MIYFTADTHFFTSARRGLRLSTLRVGAREFSTVEERKKFLVRRWNEKVRPEDEIYILGDFSDGTPEQTATLLRQLNGKKYLIIGNNDCYLEDEHFPQGELFAWVRPYYELHALGTTFVLFHFPIEVWAGYRKNSVHLHGHTHRRVPMIEPIRRYEVGVDSHDGYPVSIDEVWRAVEPMHNENRPFQRTK